MVHGVRTVGNHELCEKKHIINTTCKIFYPLYRTPTGEVTDNYFLTGTLIASDWVVRVCHSKEPEINLSALPLITMNDSSGRLYCSSVDRIVPCPAKYHADRSGEFFTITFLHLSIPINAIRPLKYDLSLNDTLMGKSGVLMGHDWRYDGVNWGEIGDEEMSSDAFIESIGGIVDARPKAGELTIEGCGKVAARMDLLHNIDLMATGEQIHFNAERLEEIFPINSKSFESTTVYNLFKNRVISTIKNTVRSDYGYLHDQNVFLCSTYNDPKFSSRELVSKDWAIRPKFPMALEGEGAPEVKDVGAGIYTYSGDEPLLLGIVGFVDCMKYQCLEMNGEKLGRTTLIVPARLIKYLFDEYCVSPKPQKGKKGSGKNRSKLKRKQTKKGEREKEKEEVAEENRSDLDQESDTDLGSVSESEQSAHEEEEKEVPETAVQSESEFLRSQLNNAHWTAIVTKTSPDNRPYKETYNFYFKKSGVCEHSVGLIKSRCIMGDHIGFGTWSIQKRKRGKPRVVVTLNNKAGFKDQVYVFVLNADAQLVEVEDRANIASEQEKTGKVRNLMSLKKIRNSCKDLLAYFSFDETYESTVSDYIPSFVLEDEDYNLYQTSSVDAELSTEALEGKWGCIGMLERSSGRLNPWNASPFEISVNNAIFEDAPYSIELKLRYALEDVKRQRQATCLKFIPTDERASQGRFPINVGVYRSNSGKVILAKPCVSICDYATRRLMELYPMQLFVRRN